MNDLSQMKDEVVLRPEVRFLHEVMMELIDGKIRIPRFQRPYVWTRNQMTDLLDSITLQYPIGTLLTWDSASTISSLRSVGPLQFDSEVNEREISYLLDGHQRLMTIAGSLASRKHRTYDEDDPDPGRWDIFYNVKDELFEHKRGQDQPEKFLFPLSSLLDTLEFLEGCSKILTDNQDNGPLYVSRLHALTKVFQTYKMPVIRISNANMNSAVEIFARLNSRGQAMNADQMVSAMLYRESDSNPFVLADVISDIVDEIKGTGFGEVERRTILRAILYSIGEDGYATDWTRYESGRREHLLGQIREVIPEVTSSLLTAVSYLQKEIGVPHARVLPYAMQLVVFSTFFLRVSRDNMTPGQGYVLKQWFWVSSFSEWFGGANATRITHLISDFNQNVACSPTAPRLKTFSMTQPAAQVAGSFDSRSARSRTSALVLISLKPRKSDGSLIDIAASYEKYASRAFSQLVSTKTGSTTLAQTVANRGFWLAGSDEEAPLVWTSGLDDVKDQEILNSHGISSNAHVALKDNDRAQFLEERLATITRLEFEFMIKHHITQPE